MKRVEIKESVCFSLQAAVMGVKMLQCFPFYRRCKERCRSRECPPAAGKEKLPSDLCGFTTAQPDEPPLFSFSSYRGDEATPVLHHIVEQRQRRSRRPQPRFSDLLLHQGQAVIQTPAGQQHQRRGRHRLRRL